MYEEVQESIERFMKALYDKKTKDRFKLVEDLRGYLMQEPHPPILNLDQIDYLLVGEEDEVKGLCHLCSEKSSIMKTIKKSAENSLKLIHALLFKKDYLFRKDVQEEFRGLSLPALQALDLSSHFKELSKQRD